MANGDEWESDALPGIPPDTPPDGRQIIVNGRAYRTCRVCHEGITSGQGDTHLSCRQTPDE